MHIISKKVLREFWEKYPDSQASLVRWFKLIGKQELKNFAELRALYPSADQVGNLIVFNIRGKRELTVKHLQALAARFHVSPTVFV